MQTLTEKRMFTTRKLTTMAMLAALSVVLVYLIHLPLFPAAPYLEYDPADIPIILATFLYGPISGLILTVVTSIVQGFTVSSGSGIIGICMHIFATGSYVLVAGNIYRRNKTRRGAIIALFAGTLTMTAAMCLWNLLLTPLYTGRPMESIAGMIIPVFMPFNLIKAGVNSLAAFLLYKPLSRFIPH